MSEVLPLLLSRPGEHSLVKHTSIPKPNHDEFMDDEMRKLWYSMGPLPGQLRLVGGTALALYRNHRPSTDFGFATPQTVVDPDFVGQFPWLKGAELKGGPGMVDATIQGETRPEWCRQAVHVLKNYRPVAISRALAAPPHRIYERLDTETVNGLRAFARGLARTKDNLDLGL